jgi:hypothetical protein
VKEHKQSTFDYRFFHQFSEDLAKFFITDIFFYAGAGTGNSMEAILIGQDRRMERPLSASPRSAFMNLATTLIKYAMAV